MVEAAIVEPDMLENAVSCTYNVEILEVDIFAVDTVKVEPTMVEKLVVFVFKEET